MKLNEENKPIQPFHLPQVSAPFKFVVDNLKEMKIDWKPVIVKAGQLKALQKSVDINKIQRIAKDLSPTDDNKNIHPIYISNKDHIIDGHHRCAAYIYRFGKDAKIKAIRLDADDKDAPVILKMIQDRWEMEEKKKDKKKEDAV